MGFGQRSRPLHAVAIAAIPEEALVSIGAGAMLLQKTVMAYIYSHGFITVCLMVMKQ
jgi:hypothetical protein